MMNIESLTIFELIGITTCIIILFIMFAYIINIAKERFKLEYKKYKDRHAFDKPPKGKCYCIACGAWRANDEKRTEGQCDTWNGYYTGRDEFCSRAYLRNDKEYDYEKWRLSK